MTSPDHALLSPLSSGSPAEASTSDRAYLQAMLDAELALTRAQQAPQAAIAALADASAFDLSDLAERARLGGNPVIPLVADLRAAVGPDHAAYVHRGATSQDIMDTATMLVASRTIAPALADLDRTITALGRLAETHRRTPMPGRTLTQHAVPTTFGLKAAGWRTLIQDARARLAAVRLPAQLGGAAGTQAAFIPGDGIRLMEAFAEETGLAVPLLPWHVLRTPIADLGTALAFTCGALGKIGADVLTLSRTEIGEVEEAGGGPSSSMPHKRNPVLATLLVAAARQLPALASILLASLVAEDERAAGAWHAEWLPLREALRLTGAAANTAAELAETLVVHPERMLANLALTKDLPVTEADLAGAAALVDRSLAC